MTGRTDTPAGRLRLIPILGLALLLAIAPGCGEDPTQLAGTLDMPERTPTKPDFKAVAKEAKEARTKGKSARLAAPR